MTTIAHYENDTLPDTGFTSPDLTPVTVSIDPVEDCTELDHAGIMEATEYLSWHAENYPEELSLLVDEGDEPLDQKWLSDTAVQVIEQIIAEEYGNPVRIEYLGGDDPHMTVTTEINTPEAFETTVDAVNEQAYEFSAVLTNLTDPGTFGHFYLMTEAIVRLGLAEDLALAYLASGEG